MTIETQYGYKIPELEDKDFWTSYNFNFERLDQHSHDGIDSPIISAGAGAGTEVSSEDELDAALLGLAPFIFITESFDLTTRKTLYNNVKIQSRNTGIILDGVAGIPGGTSMFDIPAGVSGCIIQGITLNTSLTTIDIISIQDTATKNLIADCLLNLVNTSSYSNIYIAGQQNKITSNNSDFGQSLTSPGNIYLHTTSALNVVNGNIIT